MAFELQNRLSNPPSYQQLDDDGPPSPPNPQPNLFRRWLWESLAAFVALACMGAVIVILSRMQGKPEDHWTFYFNISSTVAAFITTVKSLSLLIVGASLGQRKWSYFEERPSRLSDFDVFDEASRGPTGAIRLLWRLRTRWGFTALGAIVTIAAVSVDSFTQQVLDTVNRDVPVNSKGNETSFWVAESYITSAGPRPGIESTRNPQPSTVDDMMHGAIYRGIHGIKSSAPFDCPSQCEWEGSYTTLGVESKCENVTLTAFAKSKVFTEESNKITPVSGMIRFQTPGGLFPTYNVSYTAWSTAINVVAKQTYSDTESPAVQGASFKPDFARIGIFRVNAPARMGARKNNGIKLHELNPDQADIHECQLGFRAFEHSNIRSSGNNITIGRTVIHPLNPGVFQREGEIVVFSTPGLPTFRVNVYDLSALGNFLNSSSFSGSVYDGESGPETQETSHGLGWTLLDVNITQRFANTALSMTHQLQSGNSSSITAKAGKNVVVVTYVVVRWEFLIVPLLVVGASVLFLGITMRGTRRDTLWKSSAVAVLYHDIGQSKSASEFVLRSSVRDEKELEGLAKKIQVQYER